MPTAVHDRFAAEPLAPDSAQFPLARGSRATTEALPGVAVRPWCLRGMRELRSGVERPPLGTYDPEQQPQWFMTEGPALRNVVPRG